MGIFSRVHKTIAIIKEKQIRMRIFKLATEKCSNYGHKYLMIATNTNINSLIPVLTKHIQAFAAQRHSKKKSHKCNMKSR